MHLLDKTNLPAWRAHVGADQSSPGQPRSYPGYPTWSLPDVRKKRRSASLEDALLQRRSATELGTEIVDDTVLSRILWHAHGAHEKHARGPVPSAGCLQALELYLVTWSAAWLPPGCYHYDRAGHLLAQVSAEVDRAHWRDALVPSMTLLEGGALLWVVVGDGARVAVRYGERAERFLQLEAGHLMQNLCLLSWAAGLVTVPFGGFCERAIATSLALPHTDHILYVGALGGGELSSSADPER